MAEISRYEVKPQRTTRSTCVLRRTLLGNVNIIIASLFLYMALGTHVSIVVLVIVWEQDSVSLRGTCLWDILPQRHGDRRKAVVVRIGKDDVHIYEMP